MLAGNTSEKTTLRRSGRPKQGALLHGPALGRNDLLSKSVPCANGRTGSDFLIYLPVFIHDCADLAAFRLFSSQLVINGNATQSQISRAFWVPLVSVKRYVKLYREGGPKAIFAPRARRHGSELTPERLEKAQGLLGEGFEVGRPHRIHKPWKHWNGCFWNLPRSHGLGNTERWIQKCVFNEENSHPIVINPRAEDQFLRHRQRLIQWRHIGGSFEQDSNRPSKRACDACLGAG